MKISYATRQIGNDVIMPVVFTEIKTNSQYDSQIYKTAENICSTKNSLQRETVDESNNNSEGIKYIDFKI